jgi:uracil-DNA glycosylase
MFIKFRFLCFFMESIDCVSNKKSPEFNFLEAALVKRTELFKECTNIVVGKGNCEADILFVGESPGRNEDLQGLPFVGAAGKNLDALLEKVGLSLDDVYVANILKCRPPENRDPLPEEIKAHTPWLLKQIGDMKPRVVCSLGNYATKFFLSGGNVDKMKGQPGITQVHGKVQEIEIDGLKIKLIPLFHPAAMIYNRTKLTPLWEEDMEIVKEVIR